MAEKPSYRAWFQSLADPAERHPLDEVVVHRQRRRPAPGAARHGGAQEDLGGRLEGSLRGAGTQGRSGPMAPGGLGHEGVGAARDRERERRLDVRRAQQPVLGGALRPHARCRRPLAEALRQQPHGLLQGSRHDRAGLDGQGDARPGGSPFARSPAPRPATRPRRSPRMPPRRRSRRSCSCRGARSRWLS